MATQKKKSTVESLIDTIGKLKPEHQRYILKHNKTNEKLEGELITERQQNCDMKSKYCKKKRIQFEQ